MIKRCIFLFLAINISSLYAILGGIGLHLSQDSFTIDQESFNYESISITRDAIDSPIGGGAFVYLTVIPFIDFEAGVSLTGAEYSYVFNGEDGPAMGIAKLGWYLSAQRPVFKFPTIRMYVGGGINGSTHTKIVSYETLVDGGIDTDKLNDLEYLEDKLGVTNTGGHVELGGRFKPPIIPFSINANARYHIIKDVFPGENGYLSLSMGVAFAI